MFFVNLDISIDKIPQYLQDIKAHPDKILQYRKLLTGKIDQTIKNLEGKPVNEIIEKVRERINLWKSNFGPATIAELASMSKRWNIAIDKLYSKKITPEIIKQMLDVFLLGQEEYKTQLSTAFYTYLMKKNHYGDLPESNILVIGPSGSGKTYGMQVPSSLFHVPFVTIHCNNLVQEGIVGSTLTAPFTTLMQKWSLEELEHTIVCFDEFDKLFEKKAGIDAGTYNARIINEMLTIIDDKGEVVFRESEERSNCKHITIPNQKMMFVFTGIFEGLNDKKKRVEERPIGFIRQSPSVKKTEKILTADDFVNYGIKPEIMGRIRKFEHLLQSVATTISNIGFSTAISKQNYKTNPYTIFDFQNLIRSIRNGGKAKNDLACYETYYGPITEDMSIEDMSFYKNYLACFDIETELKGLSLRTDPFSMEFHERFKGKEEPTCLNPQPSPADFDLLQRLLYGTFSCDYCFSPSDRPNTYELTLLASSSDGERHTEIKVHTLYPTMITAMKRFMNILVEENIVMEAAIAAALLPGDRPEIVEAAVEIEQKRDKRKELFQERARQFLQEFEGPTT